MLVEFHNVSEAKSGACVMLWSLVGYVGHGPLYRSWATMQVIGTVQVMGHLQDMSHCAGHTLQDLGHCTGHGPLYRSWATVHAIAHGENHSFFWKLCWQCLLKWNVAYYVASFASQFCHYASTLSKKVIDFPVTSRNVTKQSLPGQEQLNYSPPGRVWLGTGKSLNFFYSVVSV